MNYVAEHKAWWCGRCRKYGAVADPDLAAAKCPTCNTPLVFNDGRGQWYCYECGEYPFEDGRTDAKPAPSGAPSTATPDQTAADPSSSGPPAQAQSSPLCPYCSKPLAYIPEYRAWYCHDCQKYAGVAYR
jgi:ribosomal protein L37AE/L43A